tara:strand:- start:1235 stop:2749 length:1515 start_codon:yes stop_codon:yes gene_type:complete
MLNIQNKTMIMRYIILFFTYTFSIESIAQTYPNLDKTNDEQPLNVRVCNHSNVNGSLDKTSILMILPAVVMKSGRLSSCALYESTGDIGGDTLKGIIIKNRVDESVINDCEEMICRAENSDLISERAKEVIALTKKTTKNSNTSSIRNLEKLSDEYFEFYRTYGSYKGARFEQAEELLSKPLENLIVEQFNKLQPKVKQDWITENERQFNLRVAKERRAYDRQVREARARAEAEAEAKAEEDAKAKAKAQAEARAYLDRKEAERTEKINKIKEDNIPFFFLLFLMVGYVLNKTSKYKDIKDVESLEWLEPELVTYTIFFVVAILVKAFYPGFLIEYSTLLGWSIWVAIIYSITHILFKFHKNLYNSRLSKLKKQEDAKKARKAAAAKAKAKAEAKAAAKAKKEALAKKLAEEEAKAKAEAEAAAKAKAKKEAETKIKEKEKEILSYKKQIKNSDIEIDKLEKAISESKLEIKKLEDNIKDEKQRFKKLVEKYPFLSKGTIIKNR